MGAPDGKLCAVCLIWCTLAAGVAGAESVYQTHKTQKISFAEVFDNALQKGLLSRMLRRLRAITF